jgi:hypothetical protein
MAEKLLSESEWKKFIKGKDIKDGALVKAMAAAEKGAKLPAAEQVPLLQELARQAGKLEDANSKDKPVAGQLAEIIAAAKGEIARLEKPAKETQAEDKNKDKDKDKDDDSAAALTSGLVTLLRELRKGEVRMHALICVAGKNTAVLIMRRPISPARRTLLAEAIDAKGGAKYITGECQFEDQVLAFAVQAPAAGLAKRLKAALLAQTELRLKVRVRGEDPGDVDEHEDDENDGTSTTVPLPTGAQTPAQLAYAQRLQALHGRLQEALRAQHPESSKLRAVSGFASEKEAAGDYAAAAKALDMLEKLLDAPAAAQRGGAAGTPAATAVDEGERFKTRLTALLPKIKEAGQAATLKASEAGVLARKREFGQAHALLDELERMLGGGSSAASRATASPAASGASDASRRGGLVDYAKARLAWLDARDRVEADLGKLERAILAAYRGSPDLAEAQAATRNLGDVLRSLDDALADKLDEGLNAANPEARLAINRQAAGIIARYQGFIYSSPLLREVDSNPFVPVDVQGLLISTLDDLERQLA